MTGPAPDGPVRVLLVDDQHLVRSGFRIILEVEDDIEVVGEAADGERAVAMAAALRPDVVLMDVEMPVLDGLAATRRITDDATGDGPAVLILTTFDRDDYLFAALRAGASGFLLKNGTPEDLVEAVRVVARGEGLIAPALTRRVISTFARPGAAPPDPRHDAATAELTPREREVLALVARGASNAEVAAVLHVGEATVKTHVSRVLAKLGLRDRVQAVIFAYEHGIVRPGG
ncbi:DNA-binding response regulator [Micromonospora sp. WMMA2032]|uniref:Two component transcriptional regulator, LuxR family n=1 Tax=Micromonospora sediminicola TaxID=946078 RepID=A0A1A9BD92_9ACTN|nr:MULTISPECIES: response regulator transcription factor [Micromonospora]ATO13830.1 DNA-binding response regulator [Micromonospora sp. WMMA2032]PGH45557.1 DNA-binding response regulator [Micromonospora sp. WMMA1996]SBT67470.1 two component transcriptional regulator, LuxR family [Micromonospora sediminicola]